MKAVRQIGYGHPASALRIEQIERPAPAEDQVLVRVRASSVNSRDWRIVLGNAWLVRLMSGPRRPRESAVGGDVAGTVEAVGDGIGDLKVGDDVYGVRTGAFAEYIVGRNMVRKPANLSFEEAAAVPTAALTALQALRDQGDLQPGQHVLVNGAGGGVGTFAVQIAKAMGAEVTATTRTDNVETARSLGADHVVDYTREDVTRGRRRFDLIVEMGGRPSVRALRRTLVPGGMFVQVAAGKGPLGIFGRIAAISIRSRLLRQRVLFFVSEVNKADFDTIREWIEAGKVRPVIERTYPLEEIAEAIAYAATERTRGKIVIAIAGNTSDSGSDAEA